MLATPETPTTSEALDPIDVITGDQSPTSDLGQTAAAINPKSTKQPQLPNRPTAKVKSTSSDDGTKDAKPESTESIPSIPVRPVRRTTTTSTLENIISSYSNESNSDLNLVGEKVETLSRDEEEKVKAGEADERQLIDENEVETLSENNKTSTDELIKPNPGIPIIPRRPGISSRNSKKDITQESNSEVKEMVPNKEMKSKQADISTEPDANISTEPDTNQTHEPETQHKINSSIPQAKSELNEEDAKEFDAKYNSEDVLKSESNEDKILTPIESGESNEQNVLNSNYNTFSTSVNNDTNFNVKEDKTSTPEADHLNVENKGEFYNQKDEGDSAKRFSDNEEGGMTDIPKIEESTKLYANTETIESSTSDISKDLKLERVESTKQTLDEKENPEDKEKQLDQEESKSAPTLPFTKPIPKIPSRPKKRVSADSIEPAVKETTDLNVKPTVKESTDLNFKSKGPPPKPKKLSSKIAAFQQLFNNPENVAPAPEKKIPTKTLPDSKKLSSEKIEFANNLRNVVGRGIALPGMAAPITDLSDDEVEEKEQIKTQDLKLTNNLKRARKPKGRLPKSLKESTIIEKSSRFKIVLGELWKHSCSETASILQEVQTDDPETASQSTKTEEGSRTLQQGKEQVHDLSIDSLRENPNDDVHSQGNEDENLSETDSLKMDSNYFGDLSPTKISDTPTSQLQSNFEEEPSPVESKIGSTNAVAYTDNQGPPLDISSDIDASSRLLETNDNTESQIIDANRTFVEKSNTADGREVDESTNLLVDNITDIPLGIDANTTFVENINTADVDESVEDKGIIETIKDAASDFVQEHNQDEELTSSEKDFREQ